ncbi:MAG: tetratricopeptide repeat protein [Phenylobacterium sp.]|uniref:tetratricopeptide repeat protein n=1 Tax=Phenylobacterium sp. TaxID=1871053 RepID=UPI00271B0695|nr:tetratricopeptide repeat protein [Phenylobacterium sp.]MDO8901329.1 tetratricopeptide repeat protein [Phenylobacterium sp.]
MLRSVIQALAALALGALVVSPSQAASPQAEARFKAGQQALYGADPVTARRELGQACDAGHFRACTLLGDITANGRGGPADPKRARELYAKACVVNIAWSALSEPEACVSLAKMHMKGEGGSRQPARAAYLYSRACDIGDGEACHALTNIMLDSVIIPVNSDATLGLIATRACIAKDADYCDALFDSGLITEEEYHDFKNAVQIFKSAHSLPGLGYSEKKAMLTDACEMGLGRACARASWEWQHGFQNMPVDKARALNLYLSAWVLADGAGCAELGDGLRRGDIAPKSFAEAADAYALACEVAYPPGCQALAGMHRRGEITADLALARDLERFACDSGWGCMAYADMLAKGQGGAPDRTRARQILQAECDDKDFSSNACAAAARLAATP